MQNFVSILIFEINKKFLLNKILTDELYEYLRAEIVNNFGVNYVEEKLKSEQRSASSSSRETSLSDDLIYEYFSPITNSYEISKEINYTSEYALFKNNDYLLRFYSQKNLLILIIFDSTKFFTKLGHSSITRQFYAEYYSNWYSKSFVSLIKFKFGICQDERCFKDMNKHELNNLLESWFHLFNTDQVYFTESIERLDVNEDILVKCQQFLGELVEFLFKTETIMSEFDYMNEGYVEDDYDIEIDDETGLKNSLDSDDYIKNLKKLNFNQVENFFQDLSQIDQFILTYGNKLLYKTGNENSQIDSKSLFMLLLEAGLFLECSLNDSENDDDCFQSASSSHQNSPLLNTKPISKSTPNSDHFNETFYSPNLLISNDKVKLTKFKKCHCFLKRVNKSLGSYEVLYLKLSDYLCLIMLKPSGLNKYCELISDFDGLVNELNDLLNRKRTQLNHKETTSCESKDEPKGQSSKRINELHEKSVDKNFFSFFMNKLIIFYDKLSVLKNDLNSFPSSIASSQSANNTTLSQQAEFNKKNFFSKTFSKNGRNLFKSETIDDGIMFPGRNGSRSSRLSLSTRASSFLSQRSSSFFLNNNEDGSSSKSCSKLIQQLQNKLNQLTKSKHFNRFASFINNGIDLNEANLDEAVNRKEINELLNDLRLIETQMNAIRASSNEIFYELFLSNSRIVNDVFERITSSRSSSKQRSSSNISSSRSSVLFKSTHLIDNIKELFQKHIHDYTVYMDLKWKRNIAMSYYWHQFPGLVHFSFINRDENFCCIPTIDPLLKFNLSEEKIKLAYRKYLPLVGLFLYKFDCTQFQFNDDRLEIVFSYFIWFEDKKANYLPVDFNLVNKNEYLVVNKQGSDLANERVVSLQSERRRATHPPGITDKSYYELLKGLCYPNAPTDSLICYELFCIHSSKLSDDTIKSQLNSLVDSISKITKN